MAEKFAHFMRLEDTKNDKEQQAESSSTSVWLANPPGEILAQATANLAENPLYLTTSVAHLRDALDMIPMEEKQAYMEAVRLAPALIKAESDPVKFLRCEDFNPWQSAKRLVLHWEYRKRFFKERWLLPLNETGAGALTQADIDLLRKGWAVFVTPPDPKSPRFTLVDFGRFRGHSTESLCRIAFYLGTMGPDKAAQTNGFISIRLIASKEFGGEPKFTIDHYKAAKQCWRMNREALPSRMNRVLFLKEETLKSGYLISMFLGRVASHITNNILGNDAPVMVPVPRAEGAAEILKEMGISRNVVPVSHGGTWTYDRMFEWKQVVSTEDDVGKLITIPWLRKTGPMQDESTQKATKALYAKRVYHKQRLKNEKLKEKVQALEAEKKKLQEEHSFLQSLLEQAEELVSAEEEQAMENEFDVMEFHSLGDFAEEALDLGDFPFS